MKKFVFLFYAFIVALLFNLKVGFANIKDRLGSDNIIPLLILTTGIFWAYAVWIARQYGKMTDKQAVLVETEITLTSRLAIMRYLGYSIVPVMVFHLAGVWCFASLTDNPTKHFGNYIRDYIPILLGLVGGYAALLLFRPQYALENSFAKTKIKVKEVLPQDLEPRIGLYTLFLHLKKIGGIGPVFELTAGLAVRFFDIVFIRTHSKERFVFLSDSDKLRADDILDELKKRGLDRWMIKISKYYYINMLLVVYPIVKPKSSVVLHPEVYDNMLEKQSPAKIDKMCEIGRGMPDPVKDFLADNDGMKYEGWDSFIPLR